MLNKRMSRVAALFITLALLVCAMPAALAADAQVIVSDIDTNGNFKSMTVPDVKAGETFSMFIPLVCAYGNVKDVYVELVASTDINEFPFTIKEQEYRRTVAPAMTPAAASTDVKWIEYKLTVDPMATAGKKRATLTVNYTVDDGGARHGEVVRDTVSIYINVTSGYVEPTPAPTEKPSSGGYTASVPKINFDSISIEPSELYPGDAFTLKLVLQNTSTRQSVRNIIVSYTDATATVLPAGTGSNSQFVDTIAKDGGTVEVSFDLQIVAAAEAKACQLDVKVDYEGGSSSARGPYATSASIAVPIKQRIRIKCDKPVLYDEAWVGQAVGVQQQMYNLSRATIYNCMVTVEGEGLSMDGGSYFGGNVAAGGTMRADFDLIADRAGELTGEIVIRFENANFDQIEERVPLTVFVNEQPVMEDPGVVEEPTDVPVSSGAAKLLGIAWYIWAGGGAALLAAIILLIIAGKKKRARELEEL